LTGGVLRALALWAIRVYQRWVSPHKGFACAHRVHQGGASCSAVGLRLIRRHGLRRGLPLLRQRLGRCGEVHRRYHTAPRRMFSGLLLRQRGDCDPPCDLPCDADIDCKKSLRCLECLDCGCDACDWFDRKKRRDADQRKRRSDSKAKASASASGHRAGK
jgi:uncharacterized protein